MEKGIILLKDKVGEKSESVLGGLVRRVVGKQPTTNVLKGELLERIPGDAVVPRSEGQSYQKPYNYRLVKDPSVAIYCSENDIAPLSDKEFLILEAIPSQLTRYKVFIAGDKLEWGCGLKPGDIVYVSIPSLTVIANPRAAAIIRYVGGLPPEPGLMFGIEITEEQNRGHGTSDGSFCNMRYFACEDKCGMFVALDKLTMDREDSTIEKALRGGQSYAKAVSHGTATSGQSYLLDSGPLADNTRARRQAITKRPTVHDDPLPRFKKGDRVVAFDKKGSRIHGTVRWVGTSETLRKYTFLVGIETDVTVSRVDFEGAIPGMTYLFSAPKNHRLMMPDTAILSEEEAAGTNVDRTHLTESIDVENTSILAKEMGLSTKQLMANQKAILKEAEKSRQAKAAQELEQLKQAVPDQSVNVDNQRVALQAFEKERIELNAAKRSSHPARSETYPHESNFCPPQRQHPYEAVLNSSPSSQHSYLTASVSQGEQHYNRLDPYSYRPRQSHEYSGQPQASPQDLSVANQSPQKKSLQEELVQQREEVTQTRQQLQQLQQSLDNAVTEKKSLREQLVQQREAATQTRQQFQQRLDGAAAEKKSLQEQLVQQREEVTQTRLQLQQLQQRLDGAAADNHQLQQRLHDALAANEQSQQRLGTACAELQGLQDIEPWKVSRDKVEIWTEIGSGGWGSVSEGTLRVAIKQLHHQILSPHYVGRLQREMRMLAQVRHPNLVQFLGVVLDEPALRLQQPPMIITELLDVNLRKAYERKLGFNKLAVFRDVARALNYLHERHDPIIHRDISAPNVLLEALPNGMWKGKVSDLGSANLAKLAHTLAEGAIIYAAPETLPQLAHHDPHSPPPPQTTKIDVYSYGILLCEVVTSRFPDPAQYHDMLGQVQREWPFMHDLILSCTKYNPVERPTMSMVLTKLPQP